MLALEVQSTKNFMNHLLAADTFDIFLLEEATIRTANTYAIEGRMNRDFFSREEQEAGDLCPYDFVPWKEMKGLCFNLIKGRHTPLYFKFVLHLMPSQTESLLRKANTDAESAKLTAMVLTVKFDGQKAVLTTGTAYSTFVLDKEPDAVWDKALLTYLSQKGIACEEL